MRTAIYLTNRIATRSLENKTPIEALTCDIGKPEILNLSHLRTISCKAYYYIPKEKRKNGAKFEGRAKQGILVSYEGNSIYRIYDPDRGIIRASAVVFDETNALDAEIHLDDLMNEDHDAGGEKEPESEDQSESEDQQDESQYPGRD